jgi:hypothetical protein
MGRHPRDLKKNFLNALLTWVWISSQSWVGSVKSLSSGGGMEGLKNGFAGFPSWDRENRVVRSCRYTMNNEPMNLYLSADMKKDSSMHPLAYEKRQEVAGSPWSWWHIAAAGFREGLVHFPV